MFIKESVNRLIEWDRKLAPHFAKVIKFGIVLIAFYLVFFSISREIDRNAFIFIKPEAVENKEFLSWYVLGLFEIFPAFSAVVSSIFFKANSKLKLVALVVVSLGVFVWLG